MTAVLCCGCVIRSVIVVNKNDVEEKTARLKLFAEIYVEKMKANPFMKMSARYDAMTEAKLAVSERELAEGYLDSSKLDQLLHPNKV